MERALQKIAMLVEYHGSRFAGWQYQPDQRTVQGVISDALSTVIGKGRVWGIESSGRTDSGVHARGQVVSFCSSYEIVDCSKLALSISSLLRGEVSVLRSGVVDVSFNPRKGVLYKEYRYYILNRVAPPTLNAGFAWHVREPLNIDSLNREAALLIGRHNFSAFRAVGCSNSSVIKEIFSIDIEKDGDVIEIVIRGSGFLKQMVRIIVGTLVDRVRGKLLMNLPEILESENRANGGVTAPAEGLFLHRVKYRDTELDWLCP
jgi:tRNA pseudouridine38-40 synthase